MGVLAEDWSMSEDGKTYTFQIKQGVKFSDGSDLTAEDVAKSILAVPVNLGQYNGSYGRLSTIIEDAVATDEYTVELHLTQPYYNTLRELCLANPFGIVSSEQFNENLTAKQESFRNATYGTGPYMYAGDNDGQTWNFVRNPNYWGDAPEVDSFSIKYIPDNDAKILAMQNGEMDFLSGIKNVSAESYAQMEQTDGFGAQADEKSLQTYYVGYNLSSEIFSDQVVREAISSAIDKDAVVENIYGGLFDKADTFFSRDLPYDGVQEYLDTIQELKSCSREEEYLEGLEKKLDYVVKCSFHNEIAPGAATTTAQFILRFGLVAVMLVGGILVTAGSLSIPMFILFLLFAGRIYDPFTSCFMLMAEVFSALVSVKRMKQIDATPEQTGTNVCNNKGYDIEFKNVVFSYNEEPVLKGVSFVAKQGEVTALVGPSGSGKSTASKLAARFWDADSGTITLGGVDVKTVEPETLFKNYAIVFQNVMLFDETVMENIRLGRGDATDEEVMAAAKAAQCEEFIQRLPQGYQTNIGENGSALSGGERQRISIARALLKNAPIVLLDEATASMDAESETLVQDALSVLLKDKTVMVIAHRMRTVANADKIVVLDDGKVSEMGTPAELMAKGGLYSHLVALQQGR